MARARLSDGQQLLAVNDFFVRAGMSPRVTNWKSGSDTSASLQRFDRVHRSGIDWLVAQRAHRSSGHRRRRTFASHRDAARKGFAWDAQRLVFSDA